LFSIDFKSAYEWLFATYAPSEMGINGNYRAMELYWPKEFKIWRREKDHKEQGKTLESMIESR
jgi:hypothetical protein